MNTTTTQDQATALIMKFAARNIQTMNDPTGQVWATLLGGEWQKGTLLYRSNENIQKCSTLPNSSVLSEETTFNMDGFKQTADMPHVVRVARLPGYDENGIFSLKLPITLEVVTPANPEDIRSTFEISGAAAQFFYYRAPQLAQQ